MAIQFEYIIRSGCEITAAAASSSSSAVNISIDVIAQSGDQKLCRQRSESPGLDSSTKSDSEEIDSLNKLEEERKS